MILKSVSKDFFYRLKYYRLKNRKLKKVVYSIARISNKCSISGRSKGVFAFFKMSRIWLKFGISLGLLYSFKRISF